MLRYIRKILVAGHMHSLQLIIRGVPKNLKIILHELLRGHKRGYAIKHSICINHIIFFNKYRIDVTQRAIKRRISRRLHL